MRIFTIYVSDKSAGRYFRARLTRRQYLRLDNGCMVSIGLIVGKGLTRETVARWVRRGRAVEVSHDEWNHSSCQSACVKSGASACRW